jgi:predicted phage tail protein
MQTYKPVLEIGVRPLVAQCFARSVLSCFLLSMLACGGSLSATNGGGPSPTPTPTPTPPSSIALNWNASTSANVTSYNVYRSTIAVGPYTKIAANTSQTTYVDSDIQPGGTYYYVVTAVNSSGLESQPSNQATVSIPSQ